MTFFGWLQYLSGSHGLFQLPHNFNSASQMTTAYEHCMRHETQKTNFSTSGVQRNSTYDPLNFEITIIGPNDSSVAMNVPSWASVNTVGSRKNPTKNTEKFTESEKEITNVHRNSANLKIQVNW